MTVFYSPARRPDDEEQRQQAVNASGLLNAANDPELAAIVREAAALFGTPIAAISIVDQDRQYFPAEVGLGTSETPRAASFCAHAMLDPEHLFCITDAIADGRFAGNPLVLSGPNIRFYAGVPLVNADQQPLGALCVIDRQARETPSPEMIAALQRLAGRVLERAAELRS